MASREETIAVLYQDIKNKHVELSAIRQQEKDKRNEIHKLEDELCEQLTFKFSDYIGKKVKIVGKAYRFEREPKVIIGFFHGFKSDNGYDGACIKPIIHRVKKNGERSLNTYPLYELPSELDFVSFELAE